MGLHIGIALLMEVGVFSWLSMALYPAMFSAFAAQIEQRVDQKISARTPPHTS